MNSKVIFYKGKRGAGKTLTMIKDGLKYHKNGYKVFSNFKCSFSEKMDEDKILKLDKESNLYNCIIMMDELQIFFDSRRSGKKENLNFSNFIQQLRKRNITLLGTAQFSNTVDLRFRQHIDITVYPNYIEKYPVCEVMYVDMTSIEDDILSNVSEPKTAKIIYNPIPLFKLYDTGEMLK